MVKDGKNWQALQKMHIIQRFVNSFVGISPVSISATAKLNSRMLWGFLNMDGFLRSTIQNDKLNTKDAAAITPNKTRIVASRLLRGEDLNWPSMRERMWCCRSC